MLVAYTTIPTFPQQFQKWKRNPLPFDVPGQVAQDWRISTVLCQKNEEKIARIRGMFDKAKLSASSYDTAWLAMVPSPNSEEKPLFPQCLDWVMNHQHPDGSWCVNPCHPLLIKDSLSSTIACVLALRKWKVGDLLVERALNFIEKYQWAAADGRQLTPIGFEIVFPGIMEQATENGLRLPVDSTLVDTLLHKRDNEITRCHNEGNSSHLTYLLEGLITKYEWKDAMKHQRQNGSLFNSPSATAASLIQKYDDRCHHYLNTILKKYKDAVPTLYPLDIYIDLYMIDTLQKLGIDRYFTNEIESSLDKIYRRWLQRDEDIFLDVNCCAMAFRLLRLSGYDVSSDDLAKFREQNDFFSSVSAQYKGTNTILELHKASQVIIYPTEPVLEEIKTWTSSFLNQKLRSGAIHDKRLREEVQHALNYIYDSLNRVDCRRNIELMDIDNMQLLKTSYIITNINNKDLLSLSVQDYNICQRLFRQELEEVQRWVKDNKLNQAKYARVDSIKGIHFSTSAISFAPELSDFRRSMIINSLLTVVVDDFFDQAGSIEELENLVTLFERWEENSAPEYCSGDVELIFSALKNGIKEFGTIASRDQGRDVTSHLVQIWHDLLKAMMKEAKWAKGISPRPTMEEYMENAYVSFALGPVTLIPLYSIGPKLSQEIVSSPEYHTLFKLMSLIARFLNDLVTTQKEIAHGKLNSVSLRLLHDHGNTTKEKAIEEIRKLIEDCRKGLLRLVVQRKGSTVPKACKDLFMGLSHIVHYFYKVDEEKDTFSSPNGKIIEDIKAVVWEPLSLPHIHGF